MHYAMELIANAKEAAFVADAVNMFEQREGILALKLFFAESCLHTVRLNVFDTKLKCSESSDLFDLGFSSCYSLRHAVS